MELVLPYVGHEASLKCRGHHDRLINRRPNNFGLFLAYNA